jgi:hypothetical protein
MAHRLGRIKWKPNTNIFEDIKTMKKTKNILFIILIASILFTLSGCTFDHHSNQREPHSNQYEPRFTSPYDISDINMPLSETGLSFVRFCEPRLENMERTGQYCMTTAGLLRKKTDPPHKLIILPYVLEQLPAESYIYGGGTDCRHVTFWLSQNKEYFVLISGGCVVPVDMLFGPFIYQNKWTYIENIQKKE